MAPRVSPALTLWTIGDVVRVSSARAITEAERNLDAPDQRTRLYRLVHGIEITDEPPRDATLPTDIRLPPKDVPILLAAIHARCTHLLTGDHKHFGRYFGRSVGGMQILTLREYLNARDVASP